jgi:hypothetical protein
MRSRLLFTLPPLLLAGVACAQGSVADGLGGDRMAGTTSTVWSGPCPESPCRLTAPQCGCSTGEACAIEGDAPACVAAGALGANEPCAGPGDCAPGLLCIGDGETGVCDVFCEKDADCAATGGVCALNLGDGTATGTISNVMLCSGRCDLPTSEGCPIAGTGCQLGLEQTGQMRWLTYCASAGHGASYDACSSNGDCLPGFGCLSSGSSDVCLQYCDPRDKTACGGVGCGGIMDNDGVAVVVNGVKLGVCQ